jgi:plastocyanin
MRLGAVCVLAACGGGGAASDTVGTGGNPPEQPGPNPPAGAPSGTVITTPGTTFSPATITVSQGSTVTWQFTGNTHNVTFGTAKPTGDDIPNTAAGGTASRTFANAGTYAYDCTLHSGMSGNVIVQGSVPLVFTSVAVTPSTPSVNVGATVQLSATARDQNGSAMPGLPGPSWSSSSTSVATISSGLVTGVSPGQATITATIASGATTRTATATVTVTAPSPSNVTVTTPGESFSPQVVNIAQGSTVTWQFSGSRHNVTFGSLQPAGGNIPDTDSGNSASRVFATAGTYDYQCTRHSGMTGQVIVGTGGGSTPPGGEQPPTTGTLVRVTTSGYNPERAEISPGGTITWEFAAGADGIVFEDDSPPGGNIPESASGSRVSRTFPSEGDYDYHSLKDPDRKGRIRVR